MFPGVRTLRSMSAREVHHHRRNTYCQIAVWVYFGSILTLFWLYFGSIWV